MHKKYKENVWKINSNECFLCHHMHRVFQDDWGWCADRRAQWKADCILRRYDNFALMRLNAPISNGCVAVRLRVAKSAWGVKGGWEGVGAVSSAYLGQMQMLFGCLRRIVHFNMARWVAKLTRKFRCMQISRLQQRGKWVARGGEGERGEPVVAEVGLVE